MSRKPVKTTSVTAFATVGTIVAASDSTDLAVPAKAVQVTSTDGGDVLQVLPLENADGAWVTYTGVSVGFAPLFQVRRVGEATTCGFVAMSG